MKNNKLYLILAVVAATLMSCSSVLELNDEWKNENFKTLNGKKVLVIYKTDNMVTKQRLEKDIADQINKAGGDATPSYIAFPEYMQPQKKEHSQAEIDAIVKKITDAGYSGIVLTALKDQSQQTESTTTGGYTTGGYYPAYYGGYYRGFGSYYGSVYGYPYGYGYGGTYVPQETTTRVVDVYLFETVIYNLELDDSEELVGAVSVKLTDPDSYSQVAPKYAKIIAKQFEDVQEKK